MTDESTPTESADVSDEAAASVATLDPEIRARELAPMPIAPDPINWWTRFGSPLLIPVVVVAGIVVYVLSISRIFLAADAPLDVIFGTLLTLAILIGGAMLAKSSLKGSSMALVVMGALMTVGLLGMLSIGGSEEKEAELVEFGPPAGVVKIEAGNLFFKPTARTVPVGVIELDVKDAGTHNLTFEPSASIVTETGGLEVISMPESGDYTGKVELTAPGEYIFYCSLPGHRAGGMQGAITADASLAPAPPPEGEAPSAAP